MWGSSAKTNSPLITGQEIQEPLYERYGSTPTRWIANRNNEAYLSRPVVLGLGVSRDSGIGGMYMRGKDKKIDPNLRGKDVELRKVSQRSSNPMIQTLI